MIQIDTVIQIAVGAFFILGAIIGFFVMQKGQNMKIEQLQKEVDELKKEQSKSTEHQIKTEKIIVEINMKLEHIAKAIDELKRNGSP